MEYNDIIRLIIKKRISKNYSQQKLAELCNLRAATISDIENKKKNPQLKTLIKIFKELDINIS